MAVVLVIDDEPGVQRLLRSLVERMGHDVRVAGSYTEGVDLVKSRSWDIALLDIALGTDRKGGIDLLRIAGAVAPDCPVLMVTGLPTLETAQEALRLGAFDYVEKDGSVDKLAEALERALKLRELSLERCRLERENLQVRQRLEAIFNSVREGIVTVDRNGRVLALNGAAASLFDVPVEEALGVPLSDMCGEERQGIAETVKKALDSGEFVRDYQMIDYTGGNSWVYVVNVTPLTGSTDEGAVLVMHDITRLNSLEKELSERLSCGNIIGKSPRMLKVFERLRVLARTDTTVLIQGPSGSGKELIATALHCEGTRAGGPLVKVNCAALPEALLESELFGHVRGAFTGATRDKPGRFELAHGGTIFLDEVGEVSPAVQLRLLRVLQEREIERVGSTKTVKIDVRVVAATNRDLLELASQRLFREDLYYRLNVVTITLPPLRERKEDIPLLIQHFLDRLQVRLKRVVNGIDPAAVEILCDYDWPGNVRQLENCLEHAVVLSEDGCVRIENLPPEVTTSSKRAIHDQCAPEETTEPQRLREVLDSVGWNRTRAAQTLGVSRMTVWRKIKQYGLDFHKI